MPRRILQTDPQGVNLEYTQENPETLLLWYASRRKNVTALTNSTYRFHMVHGNIPCPLTEIPQCSLCIRVVRKLTHHTEDKINISVILATAKLKLKSNTEYIIIKQCHRTQTGDHKCVGLAPQIITIHTIFSNNLLPMRPEACYDTHTQLHTADN